MKIGAKMARREKNFFFIIYFLLLTHSQLFSFQNLFMIDNPTAGMLNSKESLLDFNIYSPNALQVRAYYAPLSRINIGLAYGAENLIGSDTLKFYGAKVGVDLRVRLIEESKKFPALVIGFDNQGRGVILDNDKFLYPSKGLFFVFGKGYYLFKIVPITFNFGVNYSFDNDSLKFSLNGILDNLDVFLGYNIYITNKFFATIDYSLGLTTPDWENPDVYKNPWNGFLNLGFNFIISEDFQIRFILKDILSTIEKSGLGDYSLEREIGFLKLFY